MQFVGTFWALVPPIIAITLALITKEAYSSLFIGVVIGALTPDGDLDLDAMRRLMNCAGNMDDAAPRVRYDARPVCGHGGRHPSGL